MDTRLSRLMYLEDIALIYIPINGYEVVPGSPQMKIFFFGEFQVHVGYCLGLASRK